ncbi:MAG: glycosyltransferase family 39 protein [Anaerolineae bacterium]|nr:glycosyltransferase family 39 protein [Anaerolineae bacterium]MDW8068052.1 glycosyltransferase family 39 protein [Anaerolineae bacterium]
MITGYRLSLALILFLYVLTGVLYAVYTPPWQAPDEPAHYNYIRALAEERTLPVIEKGDYDQAYLNGLTAEKFPPGRSIAPLRYEDHQPPLYYLLAVPIYLLSGGALIPLRLFSVALGLLLLMVADRLVRDLFPDRPFLALATVILMALCPQHVAMTAAVNNDPLAELVLGLALWLAIRPHPRPWTLGAVVGLALLTKTTAYVALPVALVALGWRGTRQSAEERGCSTKAVKSGGSSLPASYVVRAGPMLLAALLLAGPWLIRNITVYGWTDPLGLARHNAIVQGQPRTAEWLAQYGFSGLAARFLRTTFQSFWGQFGWMGVPMHPPVYLALAFLSLLLGMGFLAWVLDHRRPRLTVLQRRGAVLLLLSATLTGLSYLWYNLTFVQHQGRYLFPALIPLALAGALALEWWAERSAGVLLVGLGLVGIPLAIAWTLRRSALLLWGAMGMVLLALWALAGFRPRLRRALVLAAWTVGMVGLNLYALFWAIVPTLRPPAP